jgi:hypothetical protein
MVGPLRWPAENGVAASSAKPEGSRAGGLATTRTGTGCMVGCGFSDRSREHSSHILYGGSSELPGKLTVRCPPKDGQPTRTVKVPLLHRRTVAGAHAES